MGHPTLKVGGSVHSSSIENFQTFTSPEHNHNETINASSCNVCQTNMAQTINNSSRPLTSASSTATESFRNQKAVVAPKIQGKHIKPQNMRLKVNK